MVVIRTLKPTLKLRLPSKPQTRRGQFKITVRRNVDHPPPTPQPTPCRLWQGVEGTDGYGRRKVTRPDGKRDSTSMHRWVMEQLLERRLKPTEVVLHACDNRLCYRIDHLSIGTVADNNADMLAKGRNSPPPVNVFHGECHPMAKLSAAQVRRIRGHYQSGLSAITIAAMFEISPSTVRRIVRGVTWKPQTRDLIAEAEKHLVSERSGRLAADGGGPSAARLPERIRPVKHLNISSTRKDDES